VIVRELARYGLSGRSLGGGGDVDGASIENKNVLER